MRLDASWLTQPSTVAVLDAIEGAGHGAWFVGGCVRNGLLGRPVDDLDITTTAMPEEVMAQAEAAGLKAVPTGIEYGTVTLVSDHVPHEVTTLRRDVTTDGRRATVAFTDRLDEDAHRRDFTMNALYALRDGTVVDPTEEGLSDLAARRLRFIGDPHARISEDYLRILRFFRFHAWYADPGGGIDPEGLAACAEMSSGIARLSRERVGAEMKKLLSAPDPSQAVSAMAQSGVLQQTLPGADATRLPLLVHLEGGLTPDPLRRLAVLGGEDLDNRLRLSRSDSRQLALLSDEMSSSAGPGELGYRHGAETARDILLLRAASLEQPLNVDDLAAAKAGADAVFPLKAKDLMPAHRGAALGEALARREARWIASGFTLSRDDLID